MHKLLSWVLVSILSSASMLLFATESTPDIPETPENAQPGFTMQHYVQGQPPLEKKPIKFDPIALLEMFKNDTAALLAKQTKPLQFDTQIDWVSPEDKQAGKTQWPSLTAKTTIDKQGKGRSAINLPAFQHQSDQYVIDWQGLTGQLGFTDQLDDFTLALTAADFGLEKDKHTTFSLAGWQLNTQIDADFTPIKIQATLPRLMIKDATRQLTVQKIALNSHVGTTPGGLKINNGDLTVEQIAFSGDENPITLRDLKIAGQGNVEKEVLRYALKTHLGNLTVPTLDDKPMSMTYQGDLVVNHIDAMAAKALQDMIHQLEAQYRQGMISEEMISFAMLGKLLEVAPQLLSRNPEINLTQLQLKTPEGVLQGTAAVRLEGKKVTALADVSSLIQALNATARFDLDKSLLEKIMINQRYHHLGQTDPTLTEAQRRTQAQTESQAQIKQYLEQKWLVATSDTRYTLAAQFQAGQLQVNGQKVALPFLKSFQPAPVGDKPE